MFGFLSNKSTSKGGADETPKPATVSLGANLPIGSKALSAEINNISAKFSKTNLKYRTEIEKYKKIAEFNKALSKSYMTNVVAMVDISKLLRDYASFFRVLKEEIEKTDSQMGTLKSEDIQYLESLTKSKVEDISKQFLETSDEVKGLFKLYGEDGDEKKIENVQESFKGIVEQANSTFGTLKTSVENNAKANAAASASSQKGGRQRRTQVKVTQQESRNVQTITRKLATVPRTSSKRPALHSKK